MSAQVQNSPLLAAALVAACVFSGAALAAEPWAVESPSALGISSAGAATHLVLPPILPGVTRGTEGAPTSLPLPPPPPGSIRPVMGSDGKPVQPTSVYAGPKGEAVSISVRVALGEDYSSAREAVPAKATATEDGKSPSGVLVVPRGALLLGIITPNGKNLCLSVRSISLPGGRAADVNSDIECAPPAAFRERVMHSVKILPRPNPAQR